MSNPSPFVLPGAGVYPWIDKDHSYAGWVANVSGHLSFQLVDPFSRHPTFNHQPSLAGPRTLVVHRLRFAQDYPFPDWLVRMFRRSASQDYILIGESGPTKTPWFKGDKLELAQDDHGVLCGHVAVLPREDDKAAIRARRELLDRIDRHIDESNGDVVRQQYGPQQRLARTILQDIEAARASIACYVMRFALFRTGELRIWFDLEDLLGRDLAAEPATAEELDMADHVAPQTYYFIKDLFHAHYHHNPKDDQLLPLTKLSDGATAAKVRKDEIAWRYATLRGMTRVAIEYRQGKTVAGHKKAVGVIAYAQSFQTVLGRTRRPREPDDDVVEHDDIIPYEFQNMVQSIEAADAIAQTGSNALLQLFAILIGVLLSGFALWAGAVQIKPILCESLGPVPACPRIEPGAIVKSVTWIVANPTAFVVFLLAGGFLLFLFLFGGTRTLPLAERTIRWVRQLSLALSVTLATRIRTTVGGWVVMLIFLLGLTLMTFAVALSLLPRTELPKGESEAVAPSRGWTGLDKLKGKRFAESGLLNNAALAADLRALIGDDFSTWAQAMGPETPVRVSGETLVVALDKGDNADAAYLLVHPQSRRLEAGLRHDGDFTVYRTPGAILARPERIQRMIGGPDLSDAQLAASSPICRMQSPAGEKVLRLTGRLGAAQSCRFLVPLKGGQHIVLSSATEGFDVRLGSNAFPKDDRTVYVPRSASAQLTVSRIRTNAGGAGPESFKVGLNIR